MVKLSGTYVDPADQWALCNPQEFISQEAQLKLIEDGLRKFSEAVSLTNGKPRVVVFVHGGLNAYGASFDRLKELTQPMLNDGCYPIFLVWNSSLLGTYGEHLWYLRQGQRHRWLGPLTSPVVLMVDLAKGVVRFPLTLTGRLVSDGRTIEFPNGPQVTKWEDFEWTVASNRVGQVSPPRREGNTRSWWERSRHGAMYVLTFPTKCLTLPILDAVGSEAWDTMLRRTKTMFEPAANYEFAVQDINKSVTNVVNWLDRTSPGAMHLFGEKLATWSSETFTNVSFEFFGHSMGTIVLNELFHSTPRIVTTNIVYLAAACTIRHFEEAMFPYLRANTNAHFYNITLHRVRERKEMYAWDLVVRGTLLNWVDDIYAKPQTVLDRTLGSWENIMRAIPDVPDDLVMHTHFRAFNIRPSMESDSDAPPQKHGDFDEVRMKFWQSSFYWPESSQVLTPSDELPR